jgi:hypothetical protein
MPHKHGWEMGKTRCLCRKCGQSDTPDLYRRKKTLKYRDFLFALRETPPYHAAGTSFVFRLRQPATRCQALTDSLPALLLFV